MNEGDMIDYLNTLPPDDLQLEALYRKSMIMQGGERLENDFSILCCHVYIGHAIADAWVHLLVFSETGT